MKTKTMPLYEVSDISQVAFLRTIGHSYTPVRKGGDLVFTFQELPYSEVRRFFENEPIPIQDYIKQVQAVRRLIYQAKIGGRHEK